MALVNAAGSTRKSGWLIKVLRATATLTVLAVFAGCTTTPTTPVSSVKVEPTVQTLNSGDVIQINFPGAPNLNTTQAIRRDGKINLYMVGEVTALGKTPAELERELIEAYSGQLVSKEIKVTVMSSAFAVYVSGAVLRPGKITPERAVTAFDAIMEAGGFDPTRANTKAVRVIRTINGRTENHVLNLKAVLDGEPTEPFYLQSYDVVFVPEKFSWF